MKVLSDFRRLVDAVEALAIQVASSNLARIELGDASERLEMLERSRGAWEAEMEALVLKADGKLKAQMNSEARERTLKRSYEKNADPFDPDREENIDPGQDPVWDGNAPPGQTEGMLPVRVGMEADDKKAMILRMKFA